MPGTVVLAGGSGFLGTSLAAHLSKQGYRVVILSRSPRQFAGATTVGRNGGALQTLTKLTKWFLGGSVGNGKQFISWIHIDDLSGMFLRAIEDPAVHGIYNATGPTPVTNAEFMKELRSVVGRPWAP